MKNNRGALTIVARAIGSAALLFLCFCGAAGRAGVVVTHTRQAWLGTVEETARGLAVKTDHGSVTFRESQIIWHSTDARISTYYQAGQCAELAGKDAIALFLYQLSIEKEATQRQAARTAVLALRRRHAPRETEPPPTTVKTVPVTPPAEAEQENQIAAALKGKLVVLERGTRVSRIGRDETPDVDYYAIYFSAHWCGPCRQFTPQLVSFYNSLRDQHGKDFEVIFVSRDRSSDAMETYMQEAEMPWPALNHSQARKSDLGRYAGPGIPCLVLVDRKGNVIADSYVDGNYVGPGTVMNKLKQLLERDGS